MVLKKLASAFKGWEPEYLSESQISDFSKIAVDTKSDGSSEAVKGKNKADGDKSSTVGCSAQECVNFSQAHLIAWCAQVCTSALHTEYLFHFSSYPHCTFVSSYPQTHVSVITSATQLLFV